MNLTTLVVHKGKDMDPSPIISLNLTKNIKTRRGVGRGGRQFQGKTTGKHLFSDFASLFDVPPGTKT